MFKIRSLVIATMVLVASFVAVTLYGQHRTARIDRDAAAIAENAAPSALYLATVRTNLRRLQMEIVRNIGAAAIHQRFDRTAMNADRAALERALAQYEAIPAQPAERRLAAKLLETKSEFDQAFDLTLSEVDEGQLDRARTLRDAELAQSADRFDVAAQEVVGLDLDSARAFSERIRVTRRRAAIIEYLLDTIAALAAALLLLVAIRALKVFQHMNEERTRLLSDRADEFEQFAGRVAHDLKTPLGIIALRAQATQRRGQGESVAHRTIEKILEQAVRMNELIDDLLAFARAGAKPEAGACARVDEVLGDMLADLRIAAERAEARLDIEVAATSPVRCSRGVLASVVGNLLQNAIKYIVNSNAEERVVVVRAHETAASVYVTVDDTGPGLPSGMEGKIFEPFVRAPGLRQTGIGLGLATVKRLVVAHGGRVGAQSRPHKGASFWFELPKA